MERKLLKGLMSLCLSSVMLSVSSADALSPTFLPMLDGQWKVEVDHSVLGGTTTDKCFTNIELLPLYSAQLLLEQAQANKRSCRMTASNTRNSQTYMLKCDEKKLTTTEMYRLTKEAYNKYVLERSVSTIPYTPAVNYVETTTFTRVGRCAAL